MINRIGSVQYGSSHCSLIGSPIYTRPPILCKTLPPAVWPGHKGKVHHKVQHVNRQSHSIFPSLDHNIAGGNKEKKIIISSLASTLRPGVLSYT